MGYNTFWKAAEVTLIGYNVSRIRIASAELPPGSDGNRDASVVMHRAGFKHPDQEQVKYKGRWSEAALVQWAQKSTYGTIADSFSPQKYRYDVVRGFGYEASVVGILSSERPTADEMREIFLAVAKQYPQWRFAITRLSALDNKSRTMLGTAGVESSMITVLYNRTRYVLRGEEKVGDANRGGCEKAQGRAPHGGKG